jgi:nucleoside-diphosphate-sugar epimerase
VETETPEPAVRRRVLITGAAGRIGRAISPALAARWDLLRSDLNPDGDDMALDVTDLDACRTAFTGVDAVVHLAGDPDPKATWDRLRPANVVGAYTVVQAAVDMGVSRLVLASSAQAVTAYPAGVQVRAEDPPRPANLYGATKAWAEALGAWAAASSSTSVVCLRIGFFAARPPAGPEATPRNLAAWLSPADCTRLVIAATEAREVRFAVVNGISANRYRHLDLSTADAAVGYVPVDDAWSYD